MARACAGGERPDTVREEHVMDDQALTPVRHLVLVLGDQLDAKSRAFDGFDPAVDVVWMAEGAVQREPQDGATVAKPGQAG